MKLFLVTANYSTGHGGVCTPHLLTEQFDAALSAARNPALLGLPPDHFAAPDSCLIIFELALDRVYRKEAFRWAMGNAPADVPVIFCRRLDPETNTWIEEWPNPAFPLRPRDAPRC